MPFHEGPYVMMKKPKFSLHDSVKVRRCTIDLVIRVNLKGWQGSVIEIQTGTKQDQCVVEWDSQTLAALPFRYLDQCSRKEIDWSSSLLPANRLQLVEPRDTPDVLETAQQSARNRFNWIAEFGRSGERIYSVIKDTYGKDELLADTWKDCLSSNMRWPFNGIISYLDGWDEPDHFAGFPMLPEDESVRVLKLDSYTDDLGWLVTIVRRERELTIPLCNIAPSLATRGGKALDDYRNWFEAR